MCLLHELPPELSLIISEECDAQSLINLWLSCRYLGQIARRTALRAVHLSCPQHIRAVASILATEPATQRRLRSLRISWEWHPRSVIATEVMQDRTLDGAMRQYSPSIQRRYRDRVQWPIALLIYIINCAENLETLTVTQRSVTSGVVSAIRGSLKPLKGSLYGGLRAISRLVVLEPEGVRTTACAWGESLAALATLPNVTEWIAEHAGVSQNHPSHIKMRSESAWRGMRRVTLADCRWSAELVKGFVDESTPLKLDVFEYVRSRSQTNPMGVREVIGGLINSHAHLAVLIIDEHAVTRMGWTYEPNFKGTLKEFRGLLYLKCMSFHLVYEGNDDVDDSGKLAGLREEAERLGRVARSKTTFGVDEVVADRAVRRMIESEFGAIRRAPTAPRMQAGHSPLTKTRIWNDDDDDCSMSSLPYRLPETLQAIKLWVTRLSSREVLRDTLALGRTRGILPNLRTIRVSYTDPAIETVSSLVSAFHGILNG